MLAGGLATAMMITNAQVSRVLILIPTMNGVMNIMMYYDVTLLPYAAGYGSNEECRSPCTTDFSNKSPDKIQ